MTSSQLLEEIDKSRAIHASLFAMYINTDDLDTQASYKRMMINQNRSTEELIKLYRKAKREELDAEYDSKYEDEE